MKLKHVQLGWWEVATLHTILPTSKSHWPLVLSIPQVRFQPYASSSECVQVHKKTKICLRAWCLVALKILVAATKRLQYGGNRVVFITYLYVGLEVEVVTLRGTMVHLHEPLKKPAVVTGLHHEMIPWVSGWTTKVAFGGSIKHHMLSTLNICMVASIKFTFINDAIDTTLHYISLCRTYNMVPWVLHRSERDTNSP